MITVQREPLPTVGINDLPKTDRPRVLAMGGGGNAPGIVGAMCRYVGDLLESGHDVVGLFGSWGALKGRKEDMRFIDFGKHKELLRKYVAQGGTQLGVGRDMLHKREFYRARDLRKKLGLIGMCGVGGDGTTSGAQALQYSRDADTNEPVMNSVWGIKTIDNDAEGNSLAIGFMTSAEVNAFAIQDALNLAHGKQNTVIVEIYGRDNGYLTLHAVTLASSKEDPVITLLPEFPIERRAFAARYADLKAKYGYVCVAVSEGFCFAGEEKAVVPGKFDGANNPVLQGANEMLKEAITSVWSHEDVYLTRPGIHTRECAPNYMDQKLADCVGGAIARLVENQAWGNAIVTKGNWKKNGFSLEVTPLWKLTTGNAVPPEAYDRGLLAPNEEYRHYIQRNQEPVILDGSGAGVRAINEAKMQHENLIKRVGDSNFVEHNGVLVPSWAIVPDEGKNEKPTKWTDPIQKQFYSRS